MNRPYRLAAALFQLTPLPAGKLALSRAGRLGAVRRWSEWAKRHRSGEPLVWLHAASVGESQVTEPIALRLRTRHPNMQFIQTYSSPSAANWPLPAHVEQADYLPPEHPLEVDRLFETLRPAVMVVSRGDLWPEVMRGAFESQVPVAVVGATVRPTSRRLRWPVRSALEPMHRRLAFVGAVSSEDAARWVRMGASPDVVCTTGDPRDDHILERTPRYAKLLPLIPWTQEGQTLVAGSTYLPDELALTEALRQLRDVHPNARLIVVPHEAGAGSATRIISSAQSRGLAAAAWTTGAPTPSPEVRVLAIDRPGILSDLYALGSVAYVGGGFGKSGVHSLAEPAAYALPTLTGPGARTDHFAERFLRSGGAVAVAREDPTQSLAERWDAWLRDSAGRTAAGIAARRQLHEGSAGRTAEAVAAILERTVGR